MTVKIEKYGRQNPSCSELLKVPTPEPMHGSPAVVVEMLEDHGVSNVQRSRNELQEILLSVRKLREGMMSNARYDQLTVDGTRKNLIQFMSFRFLFPFCVRMLRSWQQVLHA